MTIALHGVTKTYASRWGDKGSPALSGIDLRLSPGELLVVVGPSGSGKTTLLRCVAGLETVDAGRVEVGGRDVTALPPGARDVAMVFQEYALYPHLSVAENIAFGLRARKAPAGVIEERVRRAAVLLHLDGVLDRSPGQLSGGQRQRVALARAIVREPAAFLMDEPLASLDAELRTQMRAEIRKLQRRLETTMLYVTHDQVEAMTLGDRVAVLRGGRLEQVGTPTALYDAPANAFVARFLGSPPMNLLPGRVVPRRRGIPVVGLRPERIELVAPSRGRLRGTVELIEPIGEDVLVHVEVDGQRVVVRTDRRLRYRSDSSVGLAFSDDDVHSFESPDGARIT